MMSSDHLHESSDHPHPQEGGGGGLHHREAAAAHHDSLNGSNGNVSSNSLGVGSGGGDPRLTPPTAARKRRAQQSSSSSSFWDRTKGHVRLDVDDKYSKPRRRRARNGALSSLVRGNLGFGAVCLVSFVLGFVWMQFAHDDDSASDAPRPNKLRRTPDDSSARARQWKPRGKTLPDTGAKLEQPDERQQQQRHEYGHGQQQRPQKQQQHEQQQQRHQQTQQSSENEPNSLLIGRFDVRRFIGSWDKNVKEAAALERIGGDQKPQTVALGGWNAPIAFRTFPYAKQIHGPIKNVDSHYGGLVYHSLKNEKVFARVIPTGDGDDDDDEIARGAFDPESIESDQSKRRRYKRRRRNGVDSYPNIDSKTGRKVLSEDATEGELKKYYDDDNVHVWPKANDGKTRKPRACQQAEFSSLYFPNCNNFHDRDFGRLYDDPETLVRQRPENEVYIKYLAHGYYRDVWVMEDGPWIWPERYPKERDYKAIDFSGVEDEGRTSEMVAKAYRSTALKTLQMKHNFEDDSFEEIQGEAIIMERLTKSPRIMDIYGHCGFSTMVEVVPIELEEVVVPGEGYETNEDVEKHNKESLHPKNNFDPSEKLGFALEMAESLADLHGFPDGVIVHDDVQLCQWLRAPDDGRLKLGDFNRATIMQWDTVGGEYCKFNNGEAFANYRAPEEYAVKNLDEQMDVFSFGNNIYAMLTGLWNFYDTDDDGVVQKKLIDGGLPYVDSRYAERSFAEKKLVELMYKCWVYDPAERISIFDAVDFLREAVKENNERGKS